MAAYFRHRRLHRGLGIGEMECISGGVSARTSMMGISALLKSLFRNLFQPYMHIRKLKIIYSIGL
jgi:hypothetical protein